MLHTTQRRAIILLSILREDVGHVLIEPFQFISHGEPKVLQFLGEESLRVFSLFENPLCGSNGSCLTAGNGHGESAVNLCGSKHALWASLGGRNRGGGGRLDALA